MPTQVEASEDQDVEMVAEYSHVLLSVPAWLASPTTYMM
jgi:hypothetical protein